MVEPNSYGVVIAFLLRKLNGTLCGIVDIVIFSLHTQWLKAWRRRRYVSHGVDFKLRSHLGVGACGRRPVEPADPSGSGVWVAEGKLGS